MHAAGSAAPAPHRWCPPLLRNAAAPARYSTSCAPRDQDARRCQYRYTAAGGGSAGGEVRRTLEGHVKRHAHQQHPPPRTCHAAAADEARDARRRRQEGGRQQAGGDPQHGPGHGAVLQRLQSVAREGGAAEGGMHAVASARCGEPAAAFHFSRMRQGSAHHEEANRRAHNGAHNAQVVGLLLQLRN